MKNPVLIRCSTKFFNSKTCHTIFSSKVLLGRADGGLGELRRHPRGIKTFHKLYLSRPVIPQQTKSTYHVLIMLLYFYRFELFHLKYSKGNSFILQQLDPLSKRDSFFRQTGLHVKSDCTQECHLFMSTKHPHLPTYILNLAT